MTRSSTIRLAVIAGLAVASSSVAAILVERPSKATEVVVLLLADEEEVGLLSGPTSYARMNKAIAICKGC
jgi:hypothetical protein